MKQALVSKRAEKDLGHIRDRIAEDSLSAAERVKLAILEAADQLANHPEMGKRIIGAAGKHTQTRWFMVSAYPNYLIFYRPFRDAIVVIRVLHAAQDWTRIFAHAS